MVGKCYIVYIYGPIIYISVCAYTSASPHLTFVELRWICCSIMRVESNMEPAKACEVT